MTRNELKKRLIKVNATPLSKTVYPRQMIRRDLNHIDNTTELENNKFESFFDFEEELSELESARKQVERLESNKLNQKDEPVIILEPTEPISAVKSGYDYSYSMFDDTVYEDDEEEESCIEFSEDGDEYIEEKVEQIYLEPKPEIIESIIQEIYTYKICNFTKPNGEQCKRQAPKKSDLCLIHRKK